MYAGRRSRWLALKALCESPEFATEIAAAALAAGLTIPSDAFPADKAAMAQVKRGLGKPVAFPCAEWLGSDGPVQHLGSGSVTHEHEGWLLISDQDGDLDALEERLDVYEAAFVSLLPSLYDGMHIDCTTTSDTPPGLTDDGWLRGVGIRLRFKRTEER
jgi:hypothetical protein